MKFSKWIENTAEIGEIARNEQFLLFPQCFQVLYRRQVKKPGLVWERVKKESHMEKDRRYQQILVVVWVVVISNIRYQIVTCNETKKM